MKNIIVICVLLFVFEYSRAQVLSADSINNYYYYEDIVEVPNATKEELYERSKNWMIRTFKSSDNQIIYDDLNKNTMIGASFLSLKNNISITAELKDAYFDFKMIVFFKDGKCKYRFENITYHAKKTDRITPMVTSNMIDFKVTNNKKANEKIKTDILTDINENIQRLVKSFNSNLNTQKSDW